MIVCHCQPEIRFWRGATGKYQNIMMCQYGGIANLNNLDEHLFMMPFIAHNMVKVQLLKLISSQIATIS